MRVNAALARAQLSFGAAWTAEWAFTVGLGLVAYADGGAKAVGLVGVLRLLPAALLAPPIGVLADRARREQVLMASSAARAVVTLGAALVLAADWPLAIVYVLAAASTVAFTPFRAAHSALLPSLCQTPEELTTSNVVRGVLDSLSVVLGPFIAALLVHVADVWAVFAFAGAAAAVSAALLVRLQYERMSHPGPLARRPLVAELREGAGAIRTAPELALVVGLTALQTAIRGALTVFIVVVALSLLDLEDAAVGWLQGVMGIGALAGSVSVGRLVTTHAAARWLAVGVALWGAPLILIGAFPHTVVAILALAIIGVANAIVDVGAFTIPGRMVPDEVLARVYSVLESLIALGVAAGALLAPAAIALFGQRWALVGFGVVAPAASALSWARLRRLDRTLSARAVDIELLRRVPMLRPLPASAVEQLARQAERIDVRAGAAVFESGDVGTRFYVVERGRVSIRDRNHEVRMLQRGDGFGEIALLRDVRRTMSAVALDDVELCAIARPQFVAAVTGFGSAGTLATATVTQHLQHAPGV